MAVRQINFEEYKQEIVTSKELVVIDFFATWCGPCKMLSPVLDQIAQEYDDIKVVKVDVDQVPELAILYQIASVPTIVFMKDGKTIDTAMGFMSKFELEKFISDYK